MASLFRFLIGSLISLAFLTTVTAAGKHEPFFMNVELSDAYTGTTNCTDKNHWFLITADVFLPQGSSDDIYLTVPDDFSSLPNGSFSLKYNSKTMGSVFINGSNVLKISPEGKAASNVTASFDFLAQLTTDAKKQIQSPGKIDYTFEVSTGSDFTTSINYVAQDLQALTSNGGINADNSTAWFTADIPVSMLNRPLYFTSQEAANTTYQFNTTLTSAEIVVAVDAFNQPTRSFSFSAFKDLSDSSQIKLLFNTTINGGKYIRVNFFTNVLNTASIGNTVSLDYANQLSKRNAITVTSNLYSSSQSNVQNQHSDESSNNLASSTATQETYETYYLESTTEPGVYTEIGTWIPISTLSSHIATTSATSSVLDSLNSISSPSISTSLSPPISTSFVSSTPLTTSLLAANSSTSYTATKTKAAPGKLSLGSKSNSSEEYLTYSVITTTINGEVITLTSLTPISTLSSVMPSTQGFYLNQTASSQSTFLTAAEDSIITKSKSALSSDSATSTSSSAISSSLQTKFNNSTTTSTESHGTTTIASSKSTSVEVDSYKTYAVITKDDSGAFTTYTSVRALSTLSSSSVPASSQVVVTKDKGDFTTYASGYPLTTLNSSQSSASRVNSISSSSRGAFTKDDSESFTSYSKSPTAPTTSPSSTSAISSRVASSTVLTNSVMNSTSSLWIQTQLTSTGDLQTSHSVLMYQDGGARASAGFGGLLVSFVLLWIL